jgi:hypothetical protein
MLQELIGAEFKPEFDLHMSQYAAPTGSHLRSNEFPMVPEYILKYDSVKISSRLPKPAAILQIEVYVDLCPAF